MKENNDYNLCFVVLNGFLIKENNDYDLCFVVLNGFLIKENNDCFVLLLACNQDEASESGFLQSNFRYFL